MEKRLTVVVVVTLILVTAAITYPALSRFMLKRTKIPNITLSKLDKSKKYKILGKDVNGNLIIREIKEP